MKIICHIRYVINYYRSHLLLCDSLITLEGIGLAWPDRLMVMISVVMHFSFGVRHVPSNMWLYVWATLEQG